MRVEISNDTKYDSGIHPKVTEIVFLRSDCGDFFKEDRFPNLITFHSCNSISLNQQLYRHRYGMLQEEYDSMDFCFTPLPGRGQNIIKLPELILNSHSLKELYCHNNCMVKLELNCPSLTYLDCSFNNLSNLNLNCPSLEKLICIHSEIHDIELNCPSLRQLICSHNHLTEITLVNSCLEYLQCDNNHLNILTLFCPALTDISCSNNELSYILVNHDQEEGNAILNFIDDMDKSRKDESGELRRRIRDGEDDWGPDAGWNSEDERDSNNDQNPEDEQGPEDKQGFEDEQGPEDEQGFEDEQGPEDEQGFEDEQGPDDEIFEIKPCTRSAYYFHNDFHESRIYCPSIIRLDFNSNDLNKLIINSQTLECLDCCHNSLINLEIKCPTLESLWCAHNRLKKIDLNYPRLNSLHCARNYLVKLDLKCPLLEKLWCYGNERLCGKRLTELNGLDLCDKMKKIECSYDLKEKMEIIKKALPNLVLNYRWW
jgi:hypothetical protein